MTPTSQPRPVFIAALPREIMRLVAQRGWRADRSLLGRNIHLFEHQNAVIACAGMGTRRASLAVEAALNLGPASELISIGWAGACGSRLAIGDTIHAGIVIDAQTGERFFPSAPYNGAETGILVTVAAPASVPEKKRLAASYHATAVDMEAAAVARIALARELPFRAIKTISDSGDVELPDTSGFVTPDGQFRETAFALHVALRPYLWRSVATVARGSTLAAQRLRSEIEAHIQDNRERQT